MNSAINPILYNAMSVKFRRAFKRLLSCGKHPDKAVYAHYTQVSHMPQNDHMEMRWNSKLILDETYLMPKWTILKYHLLELFGLKKNVYDMIQWRMVISMP